MNAFKSIIFAILSISVLSIIYVLSETIFFLYPRGFVSIDLGNIFNRNVVLALSTVLGIFSRHMFRDVEKHKSQKVNILSVLKNAFTSKALWISIFVCPVVLVGVFKSVEQVPDNLLAYLFAYQNGFFFESLSLLGAKK
jgi:hypothetical protein